MLPSDHFVRFYNELFKMFAEKGRKALEEYWLEISRLQETILGPYIEAKGLEGMYEYWERIRIEENCDMDLALTGEYFEIKMNVCPSLSKNLDNDAGLCIQYCEHCAGWINPVVKKYGYHPVYDMISPEEPQCHLRIYRDRVQALEIAKTVKKLNDPYNFYDLGEKNDYR